MTAAARRVAPAAVAVMLLALGACGGDRPQPRATAHDPVRDFHSVRSTRSAPVPTRIRIPAIGVDAPVQRLGTAADGTVAVPRRWDVVGWYAGGPRPGDDGPAVLLGHVDSRSGPAVFFRLPQLRAGAEVEVAGADGSTIRFRVTRVARYPKARFPTAEVYLPTLHPELRLVTCGGAFDTATGHYLDNVIAYAVSGT